MVSLENTSRQRCQVKNGLEQGSPITGWLMIDQRQEQVPLQVHMVALTNFKGYIV